MHGSVDASLGGARPHDILPGHRRTVQSRLSDAGVRPPLLPRTRGTTPQALKP